MKDRDIVKHHSSHRIFNAIMQLKDRRIYKWVYKHPLLSSMILIVLAILILYIFISFVFKYVI